jgi:hypothetical protein
MPMSRKTWLPVSEMEWYVSESIDGLPVRRKPPNFMIAMAPFATRAARTTEVLLPIHPDDADPRYTLGARR